ncbi:radical SAM protein [Thermoanaerobacterium thermosaccharolyticum]|uniref:radical SAM protein n=1 Tax=Thermoanaerobacterium thermosaccharolyticum TaxID=1517 RepID=UPI0027983E9E|nr:radical SAM protein [Thermoanaerobacterium thermosaccharolyticum]
MGIKSDLQVVALRKAYEFVDRDPETNIPKLVYFLDKFIPPGILDEQIDAVKKVISETESNWYKYIMSLWTDIDDDVRKKIFENFVINASFFSFILGGEPLVRKADIIRLCETHPDCQFSAFTNGTLIDEAFADEMLRVKNFIPAISVEGFEEDTDFRRGIGTFKKVEKAMSILKAKRLPFGISCCYTSKNVHIIGSEEYFDQMIEWGAKFCWFFTYMPIGNSAVPELMVSAEQRKFMYEQVRKFRGTKPLFTLDFWNDGEYVDGCIAGGRRYLHVNANGDIEPCAFIHYSDSNIREKTLLEALQSPLFMAYHDRQPFNENHLRPCPLLDNPDALVEMVETSGAHSTDLENPEDVHCLSAKCKIPAENWEPVADELWKCTGHCSACNKSKLA